MQPVKDKFDFEGTLALLIVLFLIGFAIWDDVLAGGAILH